MRKILCVECSGVIAAERIVANAAVGRTRPLYCSTRCRKTYTQRAARQRKKGIIE